MEKDTQTTFFHLENDNIYFRGIDSGRTFEGGYACPLFELWMAKTVAGYISTDGLKVIFDEGKNMFLVIKGDKGYKLGTYKYGEVFLYDFAGWAWLKEETKRTDAE